jgi:hypothetical protein
MTEYLGICLHLEGQQGSQYAHYNFNSLCRFAGMNLGANDNGIFKLDDGDLDYSAPDTSAEIDAFVELPTSDWGIANQKRIRSAHLGIETNGELLLTLTDDEGIDYRYDVVPDFVANKQHSVRVTAGRNNGKGRYWRIRLDNINGADFSLNNLRVFPVVLGPRPARS